ncbi:MAG TPA: hypothetical protein VGM64_03295 [Lacunisphaera sp.]
MSTVESNKRMIRFAPFALALICFLLPFIEVSCQGRPTASFTGVQLATGTELERADPITGQITRQKIAKDARILVALFCTGIAAAYAFVSKKRAKIISAIAGGTGFIFMLIAKGNLDAQVIQNGQGFLQIDYRMGFIGACLLLLAGTAISFVQAIQTRSEFSVPPT